LGDATALDRPPGTAVTSGLRKLLLICDKDRAERAFELVEWTMYEVAREDCLFFPNLQIRFS
jgi:hypothetical protein